MSVIAPAPPEGWAETAEIHAQAECDHDTYIGAGTRVWQFASVIRGARIGEDCSIASCAIVDGGRLGDRVIISHGAFIDPGILIGSDVFVGPHVSMCNDGWPRASKEGFRMDLLLSGELITTRIEDGASIGANAVLLAGVMIGRSAMIAAGAVVTRNVPPWHLFKRDGKIVEIDRRQVDRMRVARW
jgi:UDP-2-acetamido-3-amino-2,3-dideoxy-glucuronate N-acetyltransferase